MRWQVQLFSLLCMSFSLYSAEYLYPVYVTDMTAFLIYQKNPYHIELWECDRESKQAMPLLLSRYTPAGFQILPSGKSFSFVDNGSIKIKNFLKRSPRSLEFDAPICQIELVHWLDDKVFYASGKYKDIFGIFQIDYDGIVLPVCLKDGIDCMYPQKVTDSLFYIERDSSWRYRICKKSYNPINGDNFQDRLIAYYKYDNKSHEIVSFDKNPIIFLTMVSETEGFVVGHPIAVSRTDKEIPFDYYHVTYNGSDWKTEKLFSFSIKGDLLLLGSPLRLYESILPLLPRHYGVKIIFISALDSSSYLYCYDLETHTQFKINHTEQLFPPVGQFSGGIIDDHIVAVKMGTMGMTVELAQLPFGQKFT